LPLDALEILASVGAINST